MNDAPLVSVVILSWNRIDDLRFTLETLQGDSYPRLEVIVVDNASRDGTPDMVRTEFPDVRLIELPRNVGIAGWNAGFDVARGRYILVLDDDSYPEPTAVAAGAEYMEAHPRCGVAGFQVRNLRLDTEETAIFSEGPERMFIGCGAMLRTEIISAVGGFDPHLFLYEHEIEFSMRVWDYGSEVHYVPHVHIYHRAATKNRGLDRGKDCRRVYYTARNIPYVMLLHFSFRAVAFRVARIIVGRFFGAVKAGCGREALRGLVSGLHLGFRQRHANTILSPEVQARYDFGRYAGGLFFEDYAYHFRRSSTRNEAP